MSVSEHVRVQYVGRPQRRQIMRAGLVALDVVLLYAAGALASIVRFSAPGVFVNFESISTDISYGSLEIAFTVIWVVAFALEHLYDPERLEWERGTLRRVVRSLALGVVAFVFLAFVVKAPDISRFWIILAFIFAAILVSLGRVIVRAALRDARLRGTFLRKTLIVGSNEEAVAVTRALRRAPELGLHPVGCLATSAALGREGAPPEDLPPLVGYARELREIVLEQRVDTVVIASTAFEQDILTRMLTELRGIDVSIRVSAGLMDVHSSRIMLREVAGVPFVAVRAVSLSRVNLATKRVFDVTLGMLGIIIGMPLWLVIAALIYLESPGPIFYRQPRVGHGGRQFGMFKFRSMCMDAEARLADLQAANEADGPLFKMKDDPRVTRIGKWIRRFSIDEFPQLLNVIRGEMSLVGPRPPLPRETEQYTDTQWRRMEVPPGMTGLWQVSGRSALSFDDMVRLDVFYIENWSVGFDLEIMARTPSAVLSARGAY